VSNSRRATVMDSVSYHGHEGVRQFWQESLSVFGTVDLDVEELIDAGDRVVALIREREIGRTSGAAVDGRHVAVGTLADGKVGRRESVDNREHAVKGVGLAGQPVWTEERRVVPAG